MKKILEYNKKKLIKNNKGVTLIALIITIIVLLILAGVALGLTIGPSGIITRAKEAKEKQYRADFIEGIKLKIIEAETEKEGAATLEDLIIKLSKDGEYEYRIKWSRQAKLTEDGDLTISDIEGEQISDIKKEQLEKAEEIYISKKEREDVIARVKSNLVAEIITKDALLADMYKIQYSVNIPMLNVPDAEIYETGENVAVQFPNDLAREGYTFLGWAESQEEADAGRAKYKVGEESSIKLKDADIKLYAVWQKDDTTIYGNNVFLAEMLPNSIRIKVGDTKQLKQVFDPYNTTNANVTWESSNEAVATISESGLLEAIAEGTTTITVRSNIGQMEKSCEIIVGEEPIAVAGVDITEAIENGGITMTVGNTKNLKSIIEPSNASNKNVTWTSSNTNIATIDGNGLLTAVAAGTSTITVTTEDGSKTKSYTLIVSTPVIARSLTTLSGSQSQIGKTYFASGTKDSNTKYKTVDDYSVVYTSTMYSDVGYGYYGGIELSVLNDVIINLDEITSLELNPNLEYRLSGAGGIISARSFNVPDSKIAELNNNGSTSLHYEDLCAKWSNASGDYGWHDAYIYVTISKMNTGGFKLRVVLDGYVDPTQKCGDYGGGQYYGWYGTGSCKAQFLCYGAATWSAKGYKN